MSIKFSAEIWDMDLSIAQKLVALSLADQANDEGVCWPSLDNLQRRTGLSRSGLLKVLAELKSMGLVAAQKRFQKSSIYKLSANGLPRRPINGPPDRPHRSTTCTYDSLYIQNVIDPSSIKSRDYKSEAKEVLEFLNAKTGKAFRCVDTNLRPIVERLKTGVSVAECRMVVARKYGDWSKDPKMSTYLRPATLFRASNFENYLGECVA